MARLSLLALFLLSGLVALQSATVLADSTDDDEFVEIMPKSTHVEDDDDEYQDVVPVVVEEEDEPEPESRDITSRRESDDDEDEELEPAVVEKPAENENIMDTEAKKPASSQRSSSGSLDEEEFEGFEELTKDADSVDEEEVKEEPTTKKPALNEAHVPRHVLSSLRANWDQFIIEMIMLVAVLAYGGNFLLGKSKNASIAYAWFEAHQEVLTNNFSVVGDDGEGTAPSRNIVIREAENVFLVHCTGRANCDSLLVELQLLKRQDLVQLLSQTIRPKSDAVQITVSLSAEDMDPFVFAVAPKRNISRLMKEHRDLGLLSPEKRRCDQYGVPATFTVVSETTEVLPTILTTSFVATLKKYEELIDYIHFSDQFVPNVDQDEASKDDKAAQAAAAEALKSAQRVLIFRFNLPAHLRFTTRKQLDKLVPLMRMVLHSIDRVKKCRLSREAKEHAVKNRSKMSEEVSKLTHQQRQERAQERREDKLRKEKERYMTMEDPEKARKLQEKVLQRENKKKNPKMKTAILRRG
ncbi:PAT complex subunit CCDC47-like [Sycon ciliatum]|uniref:PAT complex subunit CCDC47-like n=1 Tax=Sycon ciliatum TaxID=27933 RepID=UPI0031F68639